MLLTQFPDLGWLRQQIQTRFAIAGGQGWPTVLLQVQGPPTRREAVTGTLSLFVNNQGTTQVTHAGHTLDLGNRAYVVTNADSQYDLDIQTTPDAPSTAIFNCHFGAAFLRQAQMYCTAPSARYLLDHPFDQGPTISFAFHSLARHPALEQALQQVQQHYATAAPTAAQEEALLQLYECLVHQERALLHSSERLKARRASTRTELFERLRLAADYLHAYYNQPLELDHLARHVCLSKFHLSRAFKALYGCAPYQYVQRLRLQTILERLPRRDASLQALAQSVGLDNASSLSRLVYRTTGRYPSAYR